SAWLLWLGWSTALLAGGPSIAIRETKEPSPSEKVVGEIVDRSFAQSVVVAQSHIAYAVRYGAGWRVALDGVTGQTYDEIGEGSLIFSRDGKRFAFAAQRTGKSLFVVDGREGEPFEEIVVHTGVF